MADSKTRSFRFLGDNVCPDGRSGEFLELYLTDENGSKKTITVELTRREQYPNGHGLYGKMTDSDGTHYLVEVIVWYGSPWLGGAKIIYDMARNT